MSETMGLLELAERCEAATGADRDLDAAIFACIAEGLGWMRHSSQACRVWASHYTETLDAAIKLVPEGWGWQVSDGGNAGVWSNGPVDAQLVHGMRFPGVLAQADGKAATPALALTAASLRARHALALSKGSDV